MKKRDVDPDPVPVEKIVAYLEAQNCTLWGRAWDIKGNHRQIDQAADWLHRVIQEVIHA